MNDRKRVEMEQALLRLQAVVMEHNAAMLQIGAALTRGTAAFAGFNQAMRESIAAEEAELIFAHPDLMDLDLHDAAWNPDTP